MAKLGRFHNPPPKCGRCKDTIEPGRGISMEVEGLVEEWCEDCGTDEIERIAEQERERLRGVHNGEDDMSESTYEVFQGQDDLWYWHLKGANGEIEAASEGYSTKEHAEEGVDSAIAASTEANEGSEQV